jgi:Arc/MetJ-type ribon-helix-helix transcriptional regulator
MKRITANFGDDLGAEIEDLVEDGEFASKSDAVVTLTRRGLHDVPDLHDRIDTLEQRLDDREERIADLESHLAETRNIESKIDDLPDKIRGRGDETYSERRQRVLDQASPLTRLMYKLTGVPADKIDELSDG